jgi:hypothetical protein
MRTALLVLATAPAAWGATTYHEVNVHGHPSAGQPTFHFLQFEVQDFFSYSGKPSTWPKLSLVSNRTILNVGEWNVPVPSLNLP